MNTLTFLLQSAFVDLKRNKVRTGLTSLGIMIGVFSVVLLQAMGVGLQVFIQQQFDSLGSNLVIVFPGNIFNDEGGFQDSEGGVGGTTFDDKDVQRLERIAQAEYVVPTFIKTTLARARDESKNTDIFASPPTIFTIRKLEAEYGRLFTDSDARKRAKVVVLGPKVAEELFGSTKAAVGKSMRIENNKFIVKGVLKSKGGGGLGGPDFDSFTYLPHTTSRLFNPDGTYAGIYIQSRSEADIPILKKKVEEAMLKRYKDEEFSVIEQTQILDAVSNIFSMVNMVLVAIGAISLIVGGIGIMNIMYSSVTERIKEVGIRRALGATKGDILSQFLSEAVVLSIFGGLLGIALAIIGVLIAQRWFPAAVTAVNVLIALGVSSGIGIFFGVFPARKAANLTPIEAIRHR